VLSAIMNPRPQSAAPQAHEYVSDSKSPNGATTIPMGTLGKPTPLYTFAAGDDFERGPSAGVNTGLRASIGAWSTKALVFGGLGLVLVAVVVGVAVGASTHHNSSSGSSVSSSGENPPSLSPVPSPTPDPNPNIGTLPANHNSVAWAYPQVFSKYGATTLQAWHGALGKKYYHSHGPRAAPCILLPAVVAR